MLSQSESAVYDRQIRLWGVSSQTKLKSSSVLVSGLSPVNIEIAKNLVLAGTNVTLHSTTQDLTENMLTLLEPRPDLPDVLTRTAEALRTLNPLAHVRHSSADLDFSEALAVVDWTRSWRQMSATQRDKLRSKTIVTIETTLGTLSVLDFDGHEILEESHVKQDHRLPLPGRVVAPSVDAAIAASACRPRKRKEPQLLEQAFKVLRGEDTLEGEVDLALAAVTGGLLAQEVVKKITGKDVPLLNTLCVDEASMGAFVQAVGEARIDWLGQVEEDVEVVGQDNAIEVEL